MSNSIRAAGSRQVSSCWRPGRRPAAAISRYVEIVATAWSRNKTIFSFVFQQTITLDLAFLCFLSSSKLHQHCICCNLAYCYKKNAMETDNIPKRWEGDVCRVERKHVENMRINTESTIDAGKIARSCEYTHITYPISLYR